jgi:eukaryotic-like serine/threonine-protein kinase
MAAKDDKRGLLGWLRSTKQAEETGRVPVVRVMPPGAPSSQTSAPAPVATNGALQRDVSLRHVDKGEIARGGMGSIRKVFDTNLQRTVAMKVLFPELRADAKIAARFAEEAQILGQLEHPNIVPVHEFGEDTDGTRYFTMYYVRGKTLTELLQEDTVADGSREAYFKLLNIFLRVCDAVAFAHSRGVVHRDLKPDNIMVGAFGEVYLMDWGISKLLGRTSGPLASLGGDFHEPVRVRRDPAGGPVDDEKGQIIGTFFYMSPEQANAEIEKIDERTDIFLLGGVLYELLTGQPPYVGSTVVDVVRQAQRANIPAPELIAPERNVPAPLSRIVMKCLLRDPAQRYPTVLQLKADVENFLKGGASFPTVVFKAGEHLMNEGDKGDQVFILNKGLVQVYKTFEGGRRHGLATLGPGAVVGEAAVLSAGERTASVVAVEDTTVTAVTRAQLDKELGLNQWMGPLVKALADRFIGVDQKLDEMRTELDVARIERWILEYFLKHGQPGAEGEREVVFTAMLKQGRYALKKREAELRRAVEGMAALKVDAARDVVAWRG